MGEETKIFPGEPPDPVRKEDEARSAVNWPPTTSNENWPPATEQSRPQRVIGTRYQIIRTIHTTESSRVSEAIDLWENQRIAIKEMKRPIDCDDEEWRELLLRFERSARTPTHPNIVRTDKEIRDDVPFIKMELIAGGDLDDRIYGKKVPGRNPDELSREKRPPPPDLDEVQHIMNDLFRALDFTHKHGIIHRDIKPANILRGAGDRWKLTDFGIARFESGMSTRYGTFMGTMAYASPEQVRAEALDERTDIYSCGVVLYELLAGQRPFRGSDETVKRKIVEGRPLAPSLVATQFRSTNDPRLLSALDKVVMRAMARDREERYSSITEFQKELSGALKGERIFGAGDPWSPPPPNPQPAPPRRGLMGVLAFGLLLAGIGAVTYRFYPDLAQLASPPPAPPAPVKPLQQPLSVPLPEPRPLPPPSSPAPPVDSSGGSGSQGLGDGSDVGRSPGASTNPGPLLPPIGDETPGPEQTPPSLQPPVPVPPRPTPPSDARGGEASTPGARPVQPGNTTSGGGAAALGKPNLRDHGGSSTRYSHRPQAKPLADDSPNPRNPGSDSDRTPIGVVPPGPNHNFAEQVLHAAKPVGTAHDTGIGCRVVTSETAPALHLPEAGSSFLEVLGVAEGTIGYRAGIARYDLIQPTASLVPKEENAAYTSCQAYTTGASGTVTVRLWRNGAWLQRTLVFP